MMVDRGRRWSCCWPKAMCARQRTAQIAWPRLRLDRPLFHGGPLDRPGVVAGKAEFDPEPVALCEQSAYCSRVVALGS